jgi:formylglycine-generating enzyme required for sulfatase activity
MSATVLVLSVLIFIYILSLLPVNMGLPFGYWGDFNIAKSAIKRSDCVASVEDHLVHKDLTLENSSFRVHTKSDWRLELGFTYEMNVRQVCERPKGILLYNPAKGAQVYSLEYLSAVLKEKNLELKNVGDILCHLDDLVPVFRANYESDEIPSAPDFNGQFLDYLVISSGPSKPETSAPSVASAPESVENVERSKSDSTELPLRNTKFDIIAVDSNGAFKTVRRGQAHCRVEDIGSGVTLEMAHIPGGEFMMGTSGAEATRITAEHKRYRGRDFEDLWHEVPQHKVKTPSFYMGRFEVTQAQWRAVAALPRVDIDLPSDPSHFKGDDLPVESVSWDEAVEFCKRLSRATGREHRLPTEAEWEYACRAGTTTMFHFGDTITTELANYDGIYPYGSSVWGVNREMTIRVGSFGAPNAFGLYDMHGNVAEMCLDVWRDTYNGAPSDGSAWMMNGDISLRVLRGGWFYNNPCQIRAASRSPLYGTMNKYYGWGFRVVAPAR